ncbi:Heparan-alpha-glucosaminide N-acetyltransferase [Arachis hypogaea]|nr:Heparan-alpha-glucosaminide N-acetyltransferase [Arachis hypogaea]
MAEIKGNHRLNVSEAVPSDDSDKKPPKTKRVASLDIFRGLTVALMVLVDDAGGQWPMIGHAPWNGCNLADFVMPFFLFIVGMAIPLALKRIPNKLVAVKKVIVRTIKLIFWGLLLSMWCGILQGGGCMYTYHLFGFTYGNYVPDWSFTVHNPDSIYNGTTFTVKCGVRGKLDPLACTEKSPFEGPFRKNAPSWCYAPFEPEGILSYSVHNHWIAFWTCTHTHAGSSFKTEALDSLGFIPSYFRTYSSLHSCDSYYLVQWIIIALLVDIWGLKLWFMPLKWTGMNAMFVYVMAAEGIFAGFINGWYYDHPHNTLVYWIQKHVFIKVWHSTKVGILLYVIFAEILFWAVVAGILHLFGIYWKF